MAVCVERVGRRWGHCLDSQRPTQRAPPRLMPEPETQLSLLPARGTGVGSRGPAGRGRPGPCPSPGAHSPRFASMPLTQPDVVRSPDGLMLTAGRPGQTHNLLESGFFSLNPENRLRSLAQILPSLDVTPQGTIRGLLLPFVCLWSYCMAPSLRPMSLFPFGLPR